jgi:hypothetical protein
MDFIKIELHNDKELIKFKYGSGLSNKIPTKSPLYRNFKFGLAGDENDDINLSFIKGDNDK